MTSLVATDGRSLRGILATYDLRLTRLAVQLYNTSRNVYLPGVRAGTWESWDADVRPLQ